MPLTRQWPVCHIAGRLASAHELVKGLSFVRHAAKMAKRPFKLLCIAWIPNLNRDRDTPDLKNWTWNVSETLEFSVRMIRLWI